MNKCPHLRKLIVSFCKIEGKLYAPSLYELHEYCRGEEHTRCPLYAKPNNIPGPQEKGKTP